MMYYAPRTVEEKFDDIIAYINTKSTNNTMSLKELGYKLSDLSDVNLFDDQEANKLAIKRYRYEFPFNSLDINTWFFDKELEVAPYS